MVYLPPGEKRYRETSRNCTRSNAAEFPEAVAFFKGVNSFFGGLTVGFEG